MVNLSEDRKAVKQEGRGKEVRKLAKPVENGQVEKNLSIMALLSKTRRKYLKRIYYRKMEAIMRSNTHQKKFRRLVITICFTISAILAALLYVGR